jgi:hypothetical protein
VLGREGGVAVLVVVQRFTVRADVIGLIHERLQIEHDVGIAGSQGYADAGQSFPQFEAVAFAAAIFPDGCAIDADQIFAAF